MRSAAGAGAASFAGIGVKRTQDAVARTAAKAIIKVLELASSVHTAEDSAPFVFAQPSLLNLMGVAVGGGVGNDTSSGVVADLIAAIRIAAAKKERCLLRQLPSLFPRTWGAKLVSSSCSPPVEPFALGVLVIVRNHDQHHGNKGQHGDGGGRTASGRH